MKAKDAAKSINSHVRNSEPWEQAVIVVCQRLVLEVEDIAESRKATTNGSLLSIFKQQQQVWEGVVRRVEGLKGMELHWKRYIKSEFPVIHEELTLSGTW